ncbi:MAG: acetyl-CoA carboxylase biotin carboxyl carrier protein subunit [Cytophagales bacterium]|nr:acetyl-CoA carboxylase biotin carboxyl carrier protein subunit [Bernardetiaceae bacterium]MDW8205208.1 acetyl-CoA carboxylase biotin carboxyl carrier protein subunit [Cytophagales bacterium]
MYHIQVENGNTYQVEKKGELWLVNQQPLQWDIVPIAPRCYHILVDNKTFNAELVKADYQAKSFTFRINNRLYQLLAKNRFDLLLEKMGMSNAATRKINDLKAPMPGLILSVSVSEGQQVKKGDSLLILEAMKMENVLKAPADAVVKAVKVQQGDRVEKNAILVVFA